MSIPRISLLNASFAQVRGYIRAVTAGLGAAGSRGRERPGAERVVAVPGLWKPAAALRAPGLPSQPGLPPPARACACCLASGRGLQGRDRPPMASQRRGRSSAGAALAGADLDPADEAGAAFGAESVEELALEVGELGGPGGGVGDDLEGAVLL
jgi:hypothetical protein